jgi:nucleoside-diphosphate-sugar epimerase
MVTYPHESTHSKMKKLTIIGLGDVARRALPLLSNWSLEATTRADLDLDAADFSGLSESPAAVLYTAPPPSTGMHDTRLAALIDFWQGSAAHRPAHVVYISTTGVYGNCAGARVDESRAVRPESARAIRRVDAERRLIEFASEHEMSLSILRAPGIYALERLPLARLRAGRSVLCAADDGFSNHIHADDLAAMCVAALNQPCGIEVFNACDDAPLPMADWFCLLAQAAGLPEPVRLSAAQMQLEADETTWSFMRESRRIRNDKIKSVLGVVLRYPCVQDFVRAHAHEIRAL